MRTRVIDIVAELSTQRPRLVLLVSGLLAIAGALLAWSRLELDANTDHLIRADRPFMVGYQRFLDEFGDLEFLFVVLDTQPDEAQAMAAADALAAKLRTVDGLSGVHAVVTPAEQLRIATRAATDQELGELALAGEGVGALVASARASEEAAASPAVAARLARFATDQLRSAASSGSSSGPQEGAAGRGAASNRGTDERGEGANTASAERSGPAAQAVASAVLVLKALCAGDDRAQADSLGPLLPSGQAPIHLRADGDRYLLVQVLPEKNFGTLAIIEKPLREIRAAIDEVRVAFPDVEMGLTGKPVLQADELATTNADMVRGASVGLALCAVLLMVAMHGAVRPLLSVAAFIAAFGWTYGFATLAVGRLNLLSTVFMLVLVAAGLDYGVHVIARYLEERVKMPKASVARAVRAAVRVSLRGNLTGALTSCVVFLTALATNFQGLRELGIIASAGLMLCVIAMGTVLPALLVLVERRHRLGTPTLGHSGGTSGFAGAPVRKPWVTLGAIALATVAMLPGLRSLRFEENLLDLQNPTLQSVVWERRLAAESAGNSWFGASIVDRMEEIPATLERARGQPAIGAVRSVLDIVRLPSEARETMHAALRARVASGEAKLAAAGRVPEGANEPLALAAAIDESLTALRPIVAGAALAAPEESRQLGALVAALQRFGARLRGRDGADPATVALAAAESADEVGASLRTMLEGDAASLRDALPDAARATSVSPNGRFLVMLHPRENVWDVSHMKLFIDALKATDPDVTGVPFTHFESLRDMRLAFLIMAGLSVVLVSVLVFVDFRRPMDVLLAMLPLLLSLLWTFSILGLSDVPFNLANFFAVPILIGLGVDGAVHLLHRYHEGGENRLDPGSTRRAFVLTNLTTTIGFAPLIFADHVGMRSLGIVMVVGNTACLASILLVLPATLAARERLRTRRSTARLGTGAPGPT